MNIRKFSEDLNNLIDEIKLSESEEELSEEDLDDLYDCLAYLDKFESAVSEEDSKTIRNAYEILNKLYNESK